MRNEPRKNEKSAHIWRRNSEHGIKHDFEDDIATLVGVVGDMPSLDGDLGNDDGDSGSHDGDLGNETTRARDVACRI